MDQVSLQFARVAPYSFQFPSMLPPPLLFDRDEILRMTKRADVEFRLIHYTTELALLGQIDAARELASIHNMMRPTQTRMEELDWAWEVTDEWPKGEVPKNEAHFDTLRQAYENSWKMGSWDTTPGNTWRIHPDNTAHEITETALESLLNFDETYKSFLGSVDSGTISTRKSERLVKALDISLQLAKKQGSESAEIVNLADLDARSASVVKEIAFRWGAAEQNYYLMGVEQLWPYYRDGIFATALNFEPASLQRLSMEIIDSFSTRLGSSNPPRPLTQTSLHDLLTIANTNTLQSKGAVNFWIESGSIEPGTTERSGPPLFKSPADPDEISTLEARLGIILPSDFKDLLRISNGFGIDEPPGIARGIFNGICPEAPIFGTEAVRWNEEKYLDGLLIELLDLPGEVWSGPARDDDNSMLLASIDRVLVIGEGGIYHIWLIDPKSVARARTAYQTIYERSNEKQKAMIEDAITDFAGSKDAFDALEWCLIKWTAGSGVSMKAWPSVRAYLETIVADSGKDKLEYERVGEAQPITFSYAGKDPALLEGSD